MEGNQKHFIPLFKRQYNLRDPKDPIMAQNIFSDRISNNSLLLKLSIVNCVKYAQIS